jgi:hypothetical protein
MNNVQAYNNCNRLYAVSYMTNDYLEENLKIDTPPPNVMRSDLNART